MPINEQINEWIVKNNDQNSALDADKLRQYEHDRMKYFYAIIECNNRRTAEYIYE